MHAQFWMSDISNYDVYVKNVEPAQSFNSAMLWAKLGAYLDSFRVNGQATMMLLILG